MTVAAASAASTEEAKKRSVVLTGGRGFVGRRLTAALVDANFHVFSVVRPGTSDLPDIPGLTWATLDDVCDVYDAVHPGVTINLATCYGHAGEVSDVIESNILLPIRMLEASSGLKNHLFINTDTFSAKPEFGYTHMAPYHRSKQSFLEWAKLPLIRRPDVKFVNARLEHVYGPGDGARKFVPHVIHALLRDESVALTPGDQVRDFVHVDDVVGAYLAIVAAEERLPAGLLEVEVGTGVGTTVRSFVELARTLCGSRSELLFGALPHRDGEIMMSVANALGQALIGWTAGHAPESGLRSTIMSILDQSRRDA